MLSAILVHKIKTRLETKLSHLQEILKYLKNKKLSQLDSNPHKLKEMKGLLSRRLKQEKKNIYLSNKLSITKYKKEKSMLKIK